MSLFLNTVVQAEVRAAFRYVGPVFIDHTKADHDIRKQDVAAALAGRPGVGVHLYDETRNWVYTGERTVIFPNNCTFDQVAVKKMLEPDETCIVCSDALGTGEAGQNNCRKCGGATCFRCLRGWTQQGGITCPQCREPMFKLL